MPRVHVSSIRKKKTIRGKGITMPKTKDALKILSRVTGNGASIRAGIAEARINLEAAQMIYDARTKAGLSQSKLAALIGSKQSVIARLEDAGYEGHSLTMLQRIAAAFDQQVELRFVPRRGRQRSTGRNLQTSAPSRRKLQRA
jgi:ribosome-binding protein aMBF1 (putative translation factor)